MEKKIDSMTEELTNMQNQIKEIQKDTLVNNAKKALSEAQERLNTRCEQIKSQVSDVKAQVKSTARSIVDEAKAKGRSALYRVSEFLMIKKGLLDIRENVRGTIKTTDKDIAKTALLAKGFREAGQTAANAFRTFADKPEVDYSKKEQKHSITKAVLAPMKAVKKVLVSMELHLDASIDKLDNLVENDWVSFVRQQAEFYRNAGQYITNLQIDIKEIDADIENILMETEDANCNVAQGYKIFKRLKELRLEKKAKMKELNCLYALTDYIDCESLADTCEDNLAEIKDIMEVPEHSEVTKMQPVDNGQEENMHIVEDMVG